MKYQTVQLKRWLILDLYEFKKLSFINPTLNIFVWSRNVSFITRVKSHFSILAHFPAQAVPLNLG